MSQSITVKMKDGSVREFREKGRAGGSYTISLSTDGPFAVITDEWDAKTYIPSDDIADIQTTQRPRW